MPFQSLRHIFSVEKNVALALITLGFVCTGFPSTQAQELVDQDDTGPVFVPVVPGEPPPQLPVPQVTPEVPAGPVQPPPPFIPTDIPPPGIQSRPMVPDYLDPTPVQPRPQSTPIPIPGAYSRTGFQPSASPTPAPIAAPTPTPTPAPRRSSGSSSSSGSTGSSSRAQSSSSAPASSSAGAGQRSSLSQSQVARLAESAARNRNDKAAEQLGWYYYNRDEFSSASYWFEQALEFNPGASASNYGLALSKFRGGELITAENLARARSSDPKMQTLLGDIYARRATDAFEAGRYRDAVRRFDEAAQYRKLSRNEQLILAWSYRQSNQVEAAADLFESLYRARPDQASAEGLYSSLTKMKDYERLNAINAAIPNGPLDGIYLTYEPQEYYKSGLFRAAYDSEGEKVYPILENITSPTAELGFGYAQKSGQEGESQLSTTVAPYLEVRFFPSNRAAITARIARLTLDSGTLSPGANVGTPPLEFTPYAFEPTTREEGLFTFNMRFEYQDWLTPYFEIGTSPVGGPIDAIPVGKVGLNYRHQNGYLQAEFYSKSIRQSMLSYVGMVDPYTGDTWGRVSETGIAASIFQSIAKDWTVFLGGSVAQLTGQNVQRNEKVAGTIAVAKEMNIEGFEYFTFGPALSYETYQNNQNFFTYGHGGYFSPEYIVQGVLGINVLTTEGQEWIVAGSASAGLQNNEQSSAPYFPNNPDGRTYPGSSSTTGVALIEAEGAYLINPNWLIGGSLAYTVTADYNEGWATIYLRYIFEPRNGLLRTDLGNSASYFR